MTSMNGGADDLACCRQEMSQREFRRLRREEWSPAFISKFGKLATKLYRELYKTAPPHKMFREDAEPVHVYPYGVLARAYQHLIEAGENIGEPYREPDPRLKLKQASEPQYPERKHHIINGKAYISGSLILTAEERLERARKLWARKAAAKAAGKTSDDSDPLENDDLFQKSPFDD
jgi:hypothetical protein